MNFLDAVRLACAPETRGKGAVVAFNGEINAARDVTKDEHVSSADIPYARSGTAGIYRPRQDRVLPQATRTGAIPRAANSVWTGYRACPTSMFSTFTRERDPGLPTPWWRREQRGSSSPAWEPARRKSRQGTWGDRQEPQRRRGAELAGRRRAHRSRQQLVRARHGGRGQPESQKAAILLSLALTKTSSPQDIQRFSTNIDGGVEGADGWRRTFSCSNSRHPEVLARSASLEG